MKETRTIMDRRAFLLGAGSVLASPVLHAEALLPPTHKDGIVRFGLLADLHHSFMPDAQLRFEAFLHAVQERHLDFVIQLGDLCHGYTSTPNPDQRDLLNKWNAVRLPRYNVLGNHEMDRCSKACIMDYLQMKQSFYSFDQGGVHFVVLDCMHVLKDSKCVDYDNGNYFRFKDAQINWVDPDQMEWLSDDLRKTRLPTVVFTHPCIHPYWGTNSAITQSAVRAAFVKANSAAGWQKVVACLSGHEHADEHAVADGIHYVLINSASYYYVGEKYGELARYRDPLYCFVAVDPAGVVTIEGRNSVFVPPSPVQLKYPDARFLSANISDRKLQFARLSVS